MHKWVHNIALSQFSTIGLGGGARYFVSCQSEEEIKAALQEATRQNIPVCVLGGGSNILFSDSGYPGLVLHVATSQITNLPNQIVRVDAGVVWDVFVQHAIQQGWVGIECLSGIPGTVGATPIQNVGAYGQEVADVIVAVHALDRRTLEKVTFSKKDCHFSYRQSRFKSQDVDRYLILHVDFSFSDQKVKIRYQELEDRVRDETPDFDLRPVLEQIKTLRESVLALRRRKSMVVDKSDSNSRSLGSFFTNPIINAEVLQAFQKRCQEQKIERACPVFNEQDKFKLSAAWLVENAGFKKGFSYKGVRVSEKHCLALVNVTGTTTELLELAALIQQQVFATFGVSLEQEPVLVKADE